MKYTLTLADIVQENEVKVFVDLVIQCLLATDNRLKQTAVEQKGDFMCSTLNCYCRSEWPEKSYVLPDLEPYWPKRKYLMVVGHPLTERTNDCHSQNHDTCNPWHSVWGPPRNCQVQSQSSAISLVARAICSDQTECRALWHLCKTSTSTERAPANHSMVKGHGNMLMQTCLSGRRKLVIAI